MSANLSTVPLPQRSSLSAYLWAWRDRLLASPNFQNWAARFPLTRHIARREARALFDICAGFVYAQTLSACTALNIFDLLAKGALPIEALALHCDIPPQNLEILLHAAVSLRLLQRHGNGYRLGPLGAALRGNPGIAAMVAHHRLFYADLADPVALLRGQAETALQKFWPYQGNAGQAADYSALMAASQPMVAGEILRAYNFTKHKIVMDVAGGDGSFLRLLAPQAPRLHLRLFELPEVAAQARRAFARAGLSQRSDVFEGDFTTAALPAGADLITLIRVLHDHPDARARILLAAAYNALPRGGVLLLAEPMGGTKGAEPMAAAYFGFYLLAMGSGRARHPQQIMKLLAETGFSRVRMLPTAQPLLASIIIAQREL
ncbi:MAG: methyltransferase [Acidocella sp. 20-57-95]|nr:MAG: methyltransferase [Acidocella sp. 20-57-95]OYV60594.1 MAG: methyltransferase [Acidocella sp. 21-58-7]HQT64871.1 methyltransferase [Acidocella sp.]HQU04666.1 methyltransferase [Acidocella sp.]